MSGILDAARVRPPSQNNKTTVELTADTATAAQATGVGSTPADYWISIISTTAFNITFSDDGTSTITDPATAIFPFAAGTPYSFELGKFNTHFKARGEANGSLIWWKSSRS